MNKNNNNVEDFIYNNIEKNPSNIVALIAMEFKLSRQRAHSYVAREVSKGKIVKVGHTFATRYFLIGGKYIEIDLEITPNLEETKVWSKYIKPMVLNHSPNILASCAYGFSEILNNVIDHSEGTKVYIEVKIDNKKININIFDNGIGIFQKIKNALKLDSITESLLHLSKGKFTTDPSKHTGEGIFFTSRIFDKFTIFSSHLYYTFQKKEWFLSSEKKERFGEGTNIGMVLSLNSKIKPKDIFDKYQGKNFGFNKTIVAVFLSADPGDPHVSRSQAKRLLMGLEKFKTIVLDFKGVRFVGQAFVDEIFRVFQNEYPNITIEYFNVNKEVEDMIKRGLAT